MSEDKEGGLLKDIGRELKTGTDAAFSVFPQDLKDAAKASLAKATGLDAFQEGQKSLPRRVWAAANQILLPTLSAYLRVENGQTGATPKEAMQNDLKAAAACLVDIGAYAMTTNLALSGNPEGAFMFKFYLANMIGVTVAEELFKALTPRPTGPASPAGGAAPASK